jgi:hypothetical protein
MAGAMLTQAQCSRADSNMVARNRTKGIDG